MGSQPGLLPRRQSRNRDGPDVTVLVNFKQQSRALSCCVLTVFVDSAIPHSALFTRRKLSLCDPKEIQCFLPVVKMNANGRLRTLRKAGQSQTAGWRHDANDGHFISQLRCNLMRDHWHLPKSQPGGRSGFGPAPAA